MHSYILHCTRVHFFHGQRIRISLGLAAPTGQRIFTIPLCARSCHCSALPVRPWLRISLHLLPCFYLSLSIYFSLSICLVSICRSLISICPSIYLYLSIGLRSARGSRRTSSSLWS